MPLLPGKAEVGHNIREMEAAGHPHKQAVAAALHEAYDAGAGVLLTHGDRALFLKRSDKSRDHAGEWCCPGGSVEAGETAEEAARREMTEETGLVAGDLTQIDEGDGFVTFRHELGAEPDAVLDDEHTEFRWAPMDAPPQPLHPGVAATLGKVLASSATDALGGEWLSEVTAGSKVGANLVHGVYANGTPMCSRVKEENLTGHADKKHKQPTCPNCLKKWTGAQDEALDRREYDSNDWYTVLDNPLSGVGVFEYAESSVVKGGDPRKMVGVYRPAEELSSPECVASFKLMPWTDSHPEALLGPAEQGLVPAEQKGVHGVIGEQVSFRDGLLLGNIKVFSEDLARKIAAGKRELSVGYRCDFVPSEGVYDGKPYQYVQKNIRGNHLASVRAGKMGTTARVLDAAEEQTLCFALDMKEAAVAEVTDWKAFPSFTLAQLEKVVAEGRGTPAIVQEIADRKSGASQARVTPQIAPPGSNMKPFGIKGSGKDEALDADTRKFIEDSFESLVGQLESKGMSKAYATKVAGKVAAEKGLTGHDSTPTGDTTVAEKTEAEMKKESEDRKAARDAQRSGLDATRAKDSMTSEEEEAADASEAACDAEEDKDDEKDESREARDRKSARDRRAGARDARKGARDKAARDAKGRGMDAAAVQALVDKAVAGVKVPSMDEIVAQVRPSIRREEAAKASLYGRVSPIIGAFDAAEMTHEAMAAYALDKLGAPKATDPVAALDFYLVGRAQGTPPGRAAALDASAHDGAEPAFMHAYLNS